MDQADVTEIAKEKVVHDLKDVVSSAEELLRVTASQAGEEYEATKQKLEAKLRSARDELDRIEHVAFLRAKQAARSTDLYVHEHPWQSIGIGAALGVVVGLLLGRR
ncbi:MAG: DUF883 domain-containing protein [Rhodocyclaceae bacterium]|nr:DUF883 domain-containing protein [Rhodocyclaceae bacterium]